MDADELFKKRKRAAGAKIRSYVINPNNKAS